MTDLEIVELYWRRSEEAISCTMQRYGRYLLKLAVNILHIREEAEECVNETYFSAWNQMPPDRPQKLLPYLGRIARCLALNRYDYLTAQRRSADFTLQLSELEECIPDSAQAGWEERALADAISAFLRDLYRAVGQIDGALILEAGEVPARTRRLASVLWGLAAAACLCLVCAGVFRHFQGASLIWNDAAGAPISRVTIPEGSVIRELSRAEAEDYFRLGPFPDRLGQGLELAEPNVFYLYTGADGGPVYDSTQLWYSSPDGATSVGLTLARVSAQAMPEDGLSRLRGTPVYLTAEEGPGYAAYSARWDRDGTAVSVTSSGLDRAEFTALVEELLLPGGKEEP